jgi:hypothetical protein
MPVHLRNVAGPWANPRRKFEGAPFDKRPVPWAIGRAEAGDCLKDDQQQYDPE